MPTTPRPYDSAASGADQSAPLTQSSDVGDVALAHVGAMVPAGDLPAQTIISVEQVAEEVAEAERARARAYAPKTLHAYGRDWAHFTAYCADRDTVLAASIAMKAILRVRTSTEQR